MSRDEETSHTAPSTVVYVYGLTERVYERHLDDIFRHYGTLVRLRLFRTNARPWAVLEYDTEEAADRAIAHMDQGQIDGAHVTVSLTQRPDLEVREPRVPSRTTHDRPWPAPRGEARYAPVDHGWPAPPEHAPRSPSMSPA